MRGIYYLRDKNDKETYCDGLNNTLSAEPISEQRESVGRGSGKERQSYRLSNDAVRYG